MSNLGKVSMQRSGVTKKSHFIYTKDNNTSFNFGDVQPILFHRAQTGDETHKFHFTSIIRMLDLACATFGRSDLKLSLHFVSYDDIFPNWKNVLSAVPDTFFVDNVGYSNIPLKFPTIGLDLLSLFLCTKNFASICMYYRPLGEAGRYAFYDRESYTIANLQPFFPSYVDPQSQMFSSSDFRNYYYQTAKYLSPEGSDFVLKSYDTTNDLILCVKLNDRGRRLYKVLTGLEYTFDPQNTTQVDILAMVAFYFSYFCAYSLPRYQNWLETNAYKITKYVESFGTVSLASNASSNPVPPDFFGLLKDFMHDLSECWYSENADYVSCTYSPTDQNASVDDQNLHLLDVVRGGTDTVGYSDIKKFTESSDYGHPVNNLYVDYLDQVSDDILKKLYIGVAKDTSIGYQIKQRLLSKGYHSFVSEAESHFIFSKSIPIKILDVDSTTDNYDSSTGTGKPLGAYTGKGVSSDYSGYISFTNNQPGYYIALACVVPRSKVVNALSPAHLCNNRYTHYNPDFDSVGFEEIAKEMVGKFRNVWYSRDASQKNTKIFGLQPRYTGIKTSTCNVLNGLFSLRSERQQWLPYTLDKVIVENNGAYSSDFDPASGKFVWTDADESEIIPVAGMTWRFPCDAAWKGNFERIFLQSTQPDIYWDNSNAVYPDPPTDHFLCNFEMEHESYAFMLPTDESWQTIDEDKGAPMMNVEN